MIKRWLPGGILGRTFLLLATVFLLAQVLVYILFHVSVLTPAAQGFGALLWQMDKAIRAPQSTLPTLESFQYRPAQATPGRPPYTYFLRAAAAEIARHKHGAELRVSPDGVRENWLWIRPSSDQPWIGIRAPVMDFGSRSFTMYRLLIIGLVALMGAWLLFRKLYLPLGLLAKRTRTLGRATEDVDLPTVGGPREVRQLELAIQQMRADLRQLHNERTLLLMGISHELRSPLSRMLLTLHLTSTALEQERAAMMADVQEMEATIDKFLAWVRTDSEEPWQVIELVSWWQDHLAVAEERYGLQVSEPPPDHPKVRPPIYIPGRPMSLERVMRILFDNIRRYGGGQFTYRIDIHPADVDLVIQDAGPGVSEKILHALNTGNLAPQSGHGSGLGIRLCQRIMREHQGTLTLTLAESHGLQVALRFPRSREGDILAG